MSLCGAGRRHRGAWRWSGHTLLPGPARILMVSRHPAGLCPERARLSKQLSQNWPLSWTRRQWLHAVFPGRKVGLSTRPPHMWGQGG